MEACSQTLAQMNEVKMNDGVKLTVRSKPLAREMDPRTDKSWCKRLRGKGLFKKESFEFRVNLMRRQGKWRRKIARIAIEPMGLITV